MRQLPPYDRRCHRCAPRRKSCTWATVGVPRPRARIRGGRRRCLQMSLSDLVRKNVPAASKIEAVASPEDSTKHPEDHRRRPWKRPQQSLTAFEGNDAGESPRQAHVSLWLRGCAARHIRTRWKGGLFGPFTGVPSPAPIQTKAIDFENEQDRFWKVRPRRPC